MITKMAMMIMKPYACFSLTLLATSAILSAVANQDVSPFCIAAEDKALCTQLVKGANAWNKAMINVIKAALEKAEAGQSTAQTIDSKLPAHLLPVTKESIDAGCREAYENIIDNLKQSVEFVKNDPTSGLKSHLSAISFVDCTMGIEEFGVTMPQEVDQFQNEMLKLASVLLAVADKKN